MKRRVKIGERNQVDIGGQLVEVSGHAVATYRERFASNFSYTGARQQLEGKLAHHGVIQHQRPSWLNFHTEAVESYAVIEDEGLVLPLRLHRSKPGLLVAPTCLHRS